MSYDDEEQGVDGAQHPYSEHTRGFYEPAPTGDHWSRHLKSDPRKSRVSPPIAPTNFEAQDELRWGDSETKTFTSPPAGATFVSAGQVGIGQFTQLVEINRPARVWTLNFSVTAAAPFLIADTFTCIFKTQAGVGSSKQTFYTVLTQATFNQFASDPATTAIVVPNIPAKTLFLQYLWFYFAVANATPRTIGLRVDLAAAPVTR